mmetsp:Transcript_30482/g.89128  ORF Transcript_30482/g.89128 Transcript_30482/m.89128 type:complete len:86 (+) Transcript_30482:627-884(+)
MNCLEKWRMLLNRLETFRFGSVAQQEGSVRLLNKKALRYYMFCLVKGAKQTSVTDFVRNPKTQVASDISPHTSTMVHVALLFAYK